MLKKREAAPDLEERVPDMEPVAVPEAETVAAPHAPRRPVESDYTCTARQWVRIRKMRWEQTAGFLYEMKRKFSEGALNTRDVWAAEWDLFQNRHV